MARTLQEAPPTGRLQIFNVVLLDLRLLPPSSWISQIATSPELSAPASGQGRSPETRLEFPPQTPVGTPRPEPPAGLKTLHLLDMAPAVPPISDMAAGKDCFLNNTNMPDCTVGNC